MKRNFLPFTLLIAGVMMLASCLGDDDNSSNITYYGDTAITSFSIGTMTRTYLYNNGDTIKTIDNADSTTTVDGSDFDFTIDQLKHEIYNTDSLPAGTDVSKVLCSVSSKNSGVVFVRRLSSDTLDYYTGSDSLDFPLIDGKRKREFRVYSTDGTSYRKYTVELRVHKELPDSFTWQKQTIADGLSQFDVKNTNAFAMGDNIFAVVGGENTSMFLSKGINDNSEWKVLNSNMNTVFGPDAYKNVAVLGGWIYVLNGRNLYKSQDGETWEPVSMTDAGNIKRLVGASSHKLYAITDNGMASSKDGTTWTDINIDGDAALLPDGRVSFCIIPSATNSSVERLIMTGNGLQADTAAVVWGKIEDNDNAQDGYSWSLYEGGYKRMLPNMAGLSVVRYDGALYAIGGAGLGGSTAAPFAQLYCSTDQGLTWHKSTLFSLPADMPKDTDPNTVCMTVDSYNNVWIVCAKTAQVWKMRINRLGWETEQKAFNK